MEHQQLVKFATAYKNQHVIFNITTPFFMAGMLCTLCEYVPITAPPMKYHIFWLLIDTNDGARLVACLFYDHCRNQTMANTQTRTRKIETINCGHSIFLQSQSALWAKPCFQRSSARSGNTGLIILSRLTRSLALEPGFTEGCYVYYRNYTELANM